MEGVKKKFEIWSDYKNLKSFMSNQKLNRRQARWALYLLRFNFILKHVPGGRMGKVDGLSRRSDWEVSMERDNEKQTLVKREWLKARAVKISEVVIDRVDILDKIRRSKAKDNEVIKAVEEMKRAGVKVLRDEE